MPFQKGHTINLGRKNPNAGAKKTIKGEIKDFLEKDREELPRYLKELRKLALKSPDERVKLQALTYLSDRHLGKARISVDQRVTGVIGLITPDQLEQATRQPLLDEAKLIAEYSVTQPVVVTMEEEEDST